MPTITYKKFLSNAVSPSKAHDSDVGYDLTLVELDSHVVNPLNGRQLTPETSIYDTGIVVVPQDGYYVEIVPRSSLSKYGYIMANSVGVIDPEYRGTIKVALTKIDMDTKPLPLPFKAVQMIVRKIEPVDLVETQGKLAETPRGTGGFGSSDSPPPPPAETGGRKNRRREIKNITTISGEMID